ncbi:MAG TPA: tetratricopeptide repeat protein [Chthoniobacterales bacterium]|jgi:tetratricopeptide (TPR) repeat protein
MKLVEETTAADIRVIKSGTSLKWVSLAICLALVVMIWVVFGRATTFGFFNYDDSFYVYENASINHGLTKAGLIRAFTHPLVGNWHPLTSISLMLDAQWSGLHAGGYHLVNVILHSLAVLLLFFLLRMMTRRIWRSAFVAAVFAIHPLRAESVVWISERKDVLSAVFFFLGLMAYVRYVRKPPALGRYLLVALCLTLGLLSKAMLVSFPFLLLLLDYWPLGRFHPASLAKARWLVLEKIPLLLPVAAIAAATMVAQGLARQAAHDWPLRWRIDNALVSIWIYLRQMFWPQHLAVFYPHPKDTLGIWIVIAALAGIIAVTVAVLRFGRKRPYLITGWLWYLVMLVPVIGLIQVGLQAHADRYTYLPQIGIYLLLAWGVADLAAELPRKKLILSVAGGATLVALILLSSRQVGYWSNSIRLWQHTLAVTTGNDVAERGLGTALIGAGQLDEAILHDRAALRIRPGDANGLTNLANALFLKGELSEAIHYFREVMRLRPNDTGTRRNLGKALYRNGESKEAIAQFREALHLNPGDADAAYSLGNTLLGQNKTAEAITYFRQALASEPSHLGAHYNLGIALLHEGKTSEAITQFRAALELDSRKADIHNNLAIALQKSGLTSKAISEWKTASELEPQDAALHVNLAIGLLQDGQVADAVAQWREVLRLAPDSLAAELSLAWILATAPEDSVRDGETALQLARRASRAAAEGAFTTYRVLGAAYAETHDFDDAVNTAREGAQRAEARDQPSMAELLRSDLKFYEGGIPLRDATHGRGEPRP